MKLKEFIVSEVTKIYYQHMHNGVNSFLKEEIYATSMPWDDYIFNYHALAHWIWTYDEDFFSKIDSWKGFFMK